MRWALLLFYTFVLESIFGGVISLFAPPLPPPYLLRRPQLRDSGFCFVFRLAPIHFSSFHLEYIGAPSAGCSRQLAIAAMMVAGGHDELHMRRAVTQGSATCINMFVRLSPRFCVPF